MKVADKHLASEISYEGQGVRAVSESPVVPQESVSSHPEANSGQSLVESVAQALRDLCDGISNSGCWDSAYDPVVQHLVHHHLSELKHRFHPDQSCPDYSLPEAPVIHLPGVPVVHTIAEFYIQTLRYRRLPPDFSYLLPVECGPFGPPKRQIQLPSEPWAPDVERYILQQLESLVSYMSSTGGEKSQYPPGSVLHATALSYLMTLGYDLPLAHGVHLSAIYNTFRCCSAFLQTS